MINIVAAFITGLTAGGLSCLAVQGGLLASSLASQVEGSFSKKSSTNQKNISKPNLTIPLLLFLLSKLIVYTILGFLLGLLGTVLQLTPLSRAILQIAIGIFMVGNGLRMLNVHPIFRYFAFEPPTFIRRFIRRLSKDGDHWITPVILGAMTVLIPCGITQTMMTLAVASSNPLTGAATLFAYILGSSPVFFIVAYFTTQLGSTLEKNFSTFVAIILLALGVFSIYTGSNLLAIPAYNSPLPAQIIAQPLPDQSNTNLTINVENRGYVPNHLTAPAGQTISLKLVTRDTVSCAQAFVIPALNEQRLLPNTGSDVINIPPQPAGTVMRFTCSMGMFRGDITFN
jgi:sulfite exporter TauE/SafE